MPKNVNVAKKGSNVAGKKKPSTSRSRTPNKMAGQSLGGLRGMQGVRPQQGMGGAMGQAQQGIYGGINDIMHARSGGGGMQMGGGFQTPFGGGMQQMPFGGGFNPMMQNRAPVAPGWGGGPQFGGPGPRIPQIEGGGGFRPPPMQPQMSQPFQPPQMSQRPFNGPSQGQGAGYGNAFGGPSAGGTQTMAQRPMGNGPSMGGGSQMSYSQGPPRQPFMPPPQGPQTLY